MTEQGKEKLLQSAREKVHHYRAVELRARTATILLAGILARPGNHHVASDLEEAIENTDALMEHFKAEVGP